MAADPSPALQIGLRAGLIANPGVVGAFAGTYAGDGSNCPKSPTIYDRVPVDSAGKIRGPFPYCTLGDDHAMTHTPGQDDANIAVTLHVWSRADDKIEVKTIAAAVAAMLDGDVSIVGFRRVTGKWTGTIYRREADGQTEHAIVQAELITQPA